MKVFQNRKKCGSNYLYLFTLSFYTHINWVYAIFRNSTPNMTKFDIKTCKLVFLLSLLKFQHPTQPKYQKKNQKSWTFQIKCKQIKNQLRKCFINKICQEIIRLLPILSRSPVKKNSNLQSFLSRSKIVSLCTKMILQFMPNLRTFCK